MKFVRLRCCPLRLRCEFIFTAYIILSVHYLQPLSVKLRPPVQCEFCEFSCCQVRTSASLRRVNNLFFITKCTVNRYYCIIFRTFSILTYPVLNISVVFLKNNMFSEFTVFCCVQLSIISK